MSNKKRETKDTLLGFEEEVSKTKDNENSLEKKEEEIVKKPKKEIEENKDFEEEVNSKKENSFYENNENNSSEKSNKILYIALSVVLLIVVILSVTLGLVFGINWNKDRAFIDINGDGKNDLDLIEQIIENNDYEVKNDVSKLESKSIIWGFDLAHDEGYIEDSTYNLATQSANTLAENQIKQEKQDIKDTYADSWEEEWDDKLLNLGFDDEEEYQDSLVANSLKDELDDTFSPKSDQLDGLFVVYGETDVIEEGITSGEYSSVYHSTIESSKGYSKALTKFGETMFYFYTKTQPIVSYNDTLIPFSFTSEFDGGLDGLMEFGGVENLEDAWYLLSDIATVSTSSDATTKLINLSNSNYSSTSSGVVDLSSISSASPIKFSALYLNYIFNHPSEFSSYSSTNGLEGWINLLNPIISSVNAESGGSWNTDYTLVTDEDWSSLSSEQVKEISNEVSSTWKGTTWNGNGLIQSTDRTPLGIINLPYKHDAYNISTSEFKDLSTKGDYDALTGFGGSYGLLTVSTDGFHIISPTISSYNYSTPSGTSQVEQNAFNYQSTLMLLSDLDKDVDSNANINTTDFDILDKYQTWFEGISTKLYLNVALGNEEFLEDNGLDKEDEDYQKIINYFYSGMLIEQNYKKFVTIDSDIISFYDDYSYIYNGWMVNDGTTSPIELGSVSGVSTIYDFLDEIENSYSHFQEGWNFKYNDTVTIILEGKLG